MSVISAPGYVIDHRIADRFYATTPAAMNKQVQEMNAAAIIIIARLQSGDMSPTEIRSSIARLTREANHTANLLRHAVPSDFPAGQLNDYKADHATVVRLIADLKEQLVLPGVPRQTV
jgi:phospholipase C